MNERGLKSLLVMVLAYRGAAAAAEPSPWPTVVPLTRAFEFKDASRANVDLEIVSPSGEALYRLECHPSGFEDPGFDYSGDFECRLTSTRADHQVSNLLTENPMQSRDWEHRGRFLVKDLVCGRAAESATGHSQQFRLRGMSIRLHLSDFETAGSCAGGDGIGLELRAFRFRVEVARDEAAVAAIAEPADAGSAREPGMRAGARPEGQSPNGGAVAVAGTYPEIVSTTLEAVLPRGPCRYRSADKPLDPTETAFLMPILDRYGRLAYRLECSAYTSSGSVGLLIGRWGISCGLFAADTTTVNLLGEAVDARSRRRQSDVQLVQLTEPCASQPDWGRVRTFRLRGMSLSLRLENPVFAHADGLADFLHGGLRSVVLRALVEPDSTATSPRAKPPLARCESQCCS